MANHKRLAAGGELHLPQEIIHHIQSFLDGREAARTTIFNKSWYRAWLTRPNLVLDWYGCKTFSEFSIKTMKRYEDLNLKIQTFRLRMVCEAKCDGVPFANELIGKAMKLGATDLDLDLALPAYVLPDEVLRSEALTRLSVSNFAIDLQRLNLNKDSNFKSLDLCIVSVKGDLFRDLLSRCPWIEELTLSSSTSTMRLSREEGRGRGRGRGRLDFHKLRYLCLAFLDTKAILSRIRFHCLKELEIREGYNNESKDIRICSPSLEIIRIYLSGGRIWNAVFDVPNIRRFVFEGCTESRLRFKSTKRREWESEFRTCYLLSRPTAAAVWFFRLNKLVKMLATISKVSLSVGLGAAYLGGYRYAGDGLPLSVLENLTLEGDAPKYPAFLDNLFFMCRPKLLTIREKCMGRHRINEYLLEIVRKGLVEEVKELSKQGWVDH